MLGRSGLALLLAMGVGTAAGADDGPGKSLPASTALTEWQVSQKLRELGYDEILTLGLHEGQWRGRAIRNGTIYQVEIDPKSGEVTASNRDYEYDRGDQTPDEAD